MQNLKNKVKLAVINLRWEPDWYLVKDAKLEKETATSSI